MRLLRLVVMGVLGYFLGYLLGTCSLARAQVAINKAVNLNSLNTVLIRGEVTQESMTKASLDLGTLVKRRGVKTYPIYVVLDSPGGEVQSGISFIEYAKVIPNVRTITIFSASMAAAIVEGLPGSRLITGNGVLMFHRASGDFGGQFEVGEVETRLYAMKHLIRGTETVEAHRMGLTLEQFKAKIVAELWMFGPQAVQNKAADKVVDIVCAQELTEKRVNVTFESIFDSAEPTFSGCPTIRGPVSEKKTLLFI